MKVFLVVFVLHVNPSGGIAPAPTLVEMDSVEMCMQVRNYMTRRANEMAAARRLPGTYDRLHKRIVVDNEERDTVRGIYPDE